MILFLLTFLCLYGGINFYFFFRARSILQFSGILQVALLFVLILLIIAPVLVRIAESVHLEQLARTIAYIGYVWMAFIFLFFCFSISLEFFRVIHRLIDPSASVVFLKTITFTAAAALAFALVIYGYIDAQKIRVKHLEIQTGQSLPGNGKLRIVQISDVHVGIIIRAKKLAPVLEVVRQARPDLLVSTGDLLDGELDNIMQDTVQFKAIPTPYGKFAVLGNHEYYAGVRRSMEFTKEAGFDLLRDDIRQVAGMTIFGADDITGRRLGESGRKELFEKALTGNRDGFTLLLKHQPYVDEKANFNLQLSGHTHGGQLFPFGFFTRLFFSRIYGLHKLAPDKLLYVSRGAGTWGPPVRVFAPPEITVIDLIGKK